jgi:phage terminase large subunit-like protein
VLAGSLRHVLRVCANDPSSELATRFRRVIKTRSAARIDEILHGWQIWARDDQLPPPLDGDGWRSWLILGGRGAGKTRAGAEWVRAMALGEPHVTTEPARRIALVAETYHDARSVMVEGVSGLLAVHHGRDRPVFEPSRNQLVWPNGSIAQLFSGEDPDGLRGPQFDAAWCDEIAKWKRAEAAWDMLQFALRLGTQPRQLVTTTPRNIPLLTRLMADPMTKFERVPTSANAKNLAPSFMAEVQRRYAGTALGRQELEAEIITEVAGALWRADWLDEVRVDKAPEMMRIVVALDPPVTANESSDACGIVVAGVGEDGRGYVLADRTIQGRQPHEWARAAIAAYRDFAADRIVAEANQGGEMVVSVLRQADPNVPITKVHATRGKWLRAEPVAALYAEGRVMHVGRFAKLEEQMCAFGGGGAGGRSPDRLDALVWALTALMLNRPARPSVRVL